MIVRVLGLAAALFIAGATAAHAESCDELRKSADPETIWRGLFATSEGNKTACFTNLDQCFEWVGSVSRTGEAMPKQGNCRNAWAANPRTVSFREYSGSRGLPGHATN